MDVMVNARAIVTQFWAAMQANDWAGAAAYFSDDYVLAWPQSGERISGRANFVAVNTHYPAAGPWRFTLHRLVAEGDTVVSDVGVTDGAITARVITFSIVRDGRITQQIEFWPDPFAAPAWRSAWVERDNADG
jgi:ketosteroid isomerase-like protein